MNEKTLRNNDVTVVTAVTLAWLQKKPFINKGVTVVTAVTGKNNNVGKAFSYNGGYSKVINLCEYRRRRVG
ncbi:hypothetical protein RCF98_02000 [Thiothrix lacustris]|uniref:Uncharacterized protein n=1 Tax=Thiothrix lacustris TaxID=525917 RepID=A0ABY9MRI9_9GAMM|nr:hypothetical protein [Thiothrix lacustris]WML91138.1 hypothetical protein RCF98_02000 [Thiothrix lacustris]